MHERADPPAVVLDRRRRPSRARFRQLEAPAFAVDEAPAVVDAVGELERRVAEGDGDRFAQRGALPDGDDELGDRAAREPAAEDPEHERKRHRAEQDDEHRADRVGGARRELREEVAEEQQRERGETGEVDRQQDAAQRRRCVMPAPYQQGDHEQRQRDDARRDEGAEDRLEAVRAVHDDRARAAVRAPRRLLREQEQQRRADHDEGCDRPHDQPVGTRCEAAARERQYERRERDEGEAAEEDAGGVDDVAVRVVQRSEQPEVADRREVDAGSVLRPSADRVQPGGDEAEAGRERKRERRVLVRLMVAEKDDRRRPRPFEQRDRDREGEGAAAQASSERRAAPLSSPLGTKPRAPHAAIWSP